MLVWILWIISAFIVTATVTIFVGPIRRLFYTRPLFNWFKTVLPPMSDTEQQAIAAGDVWQDANLFQGKPDWDNLLALPKPELSEAEASYLDNEVTTLCAMLDEWQITQYDYDFPPNVWNYIKTAGFFGLHVPKQYGGMEFSALAGSTIVQKIATKSLSVAVTIMVPNSLGPAELICNYGTDEQKNQYLHNLAHGIEMPCFALTAPDAGSDATAITDSGEICYGEYEGQKDVLGINLNWSKRYITLAPVATLIGLAVKLSDPKNLLGKEKDLGITVVLVKSTLPGVEIGLRHFPLNQAFMNGPIRGREVFVPLDNIIGGKEKIGKGWQMLVECLAAGRGISLPALSAAMGKLSFRTTGAYAKLRQQFKVSIGNFEGVSTAMARIGGNTYMLEAMRLLTLTAIDQHKKPSVITAISKYHMTEMARQIINDTMDVHAGRGIMLGPRNYLARLYEGVPISITVEGANILTRCLMIFGQGAIRCHPYVLQEINAVNNPDQQLGFKQFDQALAGHLFYSTSNFFKLVWHSITCGLFFSSPKQTVWGKYYKRLSLMSLALACCSDLAMLILGGNLKRKENISARLGDVLSYLYMASAVLKYNHDHGQNISDEPYVKWSLDFCLYQIQQSFINCLLNFSPKPITLTMQWLIFPPWRNYRLPSDNLAVEISKDMMKNSAFRERLTVYCAESQDINDPAARVQIAWLKMLEVEPLLHKLDYAVKQGKLDKNLRMYSKIKMALDQSLINQAQADALNEFEAMRFDAMQVDEFTDEQLTGKQA